MYSRHDLVWLNETGWEAALRQAKPADQSTLAHWRRRNWPLVVTRRTPDAQPGTVCLGLAAPPEHGLKRRIALRVQSSAITRWQNPLPLADAVRGAPDAWLPALTMLRDQARGMDLRVFGSLALQCMTAQPYLRAQSDIDVLFRPASRAQLREGVALLDRHAATLPLDGEVVFPHGAAVSWKEWLRAAGDSGRALVMVKESCAVRLASVDSLRDSLAA